MKKRYEDGKCETGSWTAKAKQNSRIHISTVAGSIPANFEIIYGAGAPMLNFKNVKDGLQKKK